MTTRAVIGLLLATTVGCTSAPTTSSRRDTMTTPNATDAGAAERTLTVDRSIGEIHASGQAVVKRNADLHVRLAGARAWAAVARTSVGQRAFDTAVDAARRGIKELGADYRPRTAVDDTELKIAAADDQLARGNTADAADVLIRVLDARIGLYVVRYADDVVQ